MFTQRCFIRKNSKKLQDLIYNFGDRGGTWLHELEYNTLLVADKDYFRCLDDERDNDKKLIEEGFIDCGTNEELFLAIAALRDDEDVNQWHVIDIEAYTNLHKGDWFKATDRTGGYHVGCQIEPAYCHKATVEELINHFKKE